MSRKAFTHWSKLLWVLAFNITAYIKIGRQYSPNLQGIGAELPIQSRHHAQMIVFKSFWFYSFAHEVALSERCSRSFSVPHRWIMHVQKTISCAKQMSPAEPMPIIYRFVYLGFMHRDIVTKFQDGWTAGKAAGCHGYMGKEQFQMVLYNTQGSAQMQYWMGHLNFRTNKTEWVGLRAVPFGHLPLNVTVHFISNSSLFSVTPSGLFMWITWAGYHPNLISLHLQGN